MRGGQIFRARFPAGAVNEFDYIALDFLPYD